MLSQIVFHPRVESDVSTVVAHYDSCSAGLGLRFKARFYVTVDEIMILPSKYARKVGDIRTCLIRPFPYLIYFAVEDSRVFILTVQYAGRSPAYLHAITAQRQKG